MDIHEQKFLVVDTETTGFNPETDRVVEVAAASFIGAKAVFTYQSLVNPGLAIPPEASAVHHLTDDDVRDAMPLDAHENTLREAAKDAVVVAHNAGFDQSFLPMLSDRPWLCTVRFAKHVYPDAPGYSNQVLRYWLKLKINGSANTPHRAASDVVVTAALLENLIGKYIELRGRTSVEALLAYVESPIKVTYMPFGKHKGELLTNVPHDYLRWALRECDLDKDLRASMIDLL